MKQYIFITENIKGAGGVQCYVAAKARHLEDIGWTVKVICSGTPGVDHCLISALDKYLDGDVYPICLPPFQYPRWYQQLVLKKLIRIVFNSNQYDEIIIESHNAATSQWGEMLASRIGARHYFYTMNEHYRGKGKHYEEKIDFYIFKCNRKEIMGSRKAAERLFDGYRQIADDEFAVRAIIDEAPVQDVESSAVNALRHSGWNICYLGRGNKPYVENIIKGVGTFAGMHSEEQVQFVVVGDIDIHRSLIDGTVALHRNLTVTELGFLHPLPRSLYSKIDVFIAGAGSARHSAEEGALVIIADTESKKSNGLLGYETMEATYQSSESVVTTFEEALERVLVDKVQEKLTNRYPKRVGVEECTRQNFELFAKSDPKKEYYPMERMSEGKRDWKRFLGIVLINKFPSLRKLIK